MVAPYLTERTTVGDRQLGILSDDGRFLLAGRPHALTTTSAEHAPWPTTPTARPSSPSCATAVPPALGAG
jgi:hypothetical protein